MSSDRSPTRSLGEIAEDIGFPVDAVILVAEIGNVMSRHCYYAGMQEAPHLTAEGFCRLLRSHAREEFGRDAWKALEQWGIYRSEDIGRIVFALVEARYLEASAEDSQDDFDRLFIVRDYFTA